MQHLDLFSGIGGFALATEMVWENVEHTFCEIDPFCQAVIRKHWPSSIIYGDIRTLTADTYRSDGQTGADEKEGEQRDESSLTVSVRRDTTTIDLLTGGFPCQPFSAAGKRRGTEDDRHLWPEMLRVIREFHPRWVIGENVGGFITWNGGLVLEQVHTDLESEGYEVQAFVIPAVSLNAPHRRDRVWIVAHSKRGGRQTRGQRGGLEQLQERWSDDASAASQPISRDAPHASSNRRAGEGQGTSTQKGQSSRPKQTGELEGRLERPHRDAPDPRESGLERRHEAIRQKRKRGADAGHGTASAGWEENWPQVATRLCTLDDGLRYNVVRPDGGRDAEVRPRPKGWRNAALKGAGNAIVPQVAAQIMLAIKHLSSYTHPDT